MFGFRNRRRPRAAARTVSAVRAAVTPVIAECLEERIVFSTVSVWVEAIQSTSEQPGSPDGKFRFHAFACTGTNPPDSVTVGFQLSGTATQSGGACGGSGDYTGDITSGTVTIPVGENQDNYTDVTFQAIDDQEVEDTETVVVTLDEPSGDVFVPPLGYDGRAATADIADDDVNVWVEAIDDQGSENHNDPVTFTIHREGGGGDLAVYYTLGGTATPGVVDDEDGTITPDDADYIAPAPGAGENYRKIIIPAGETSVSLSVAPLNDSLVEGGETVELTLLEDQDPAGPFYNAPGRAGRRWVPANLADLQAVPATDAGRPTNAEIDQWVADLSSDDWQTRDGAEAMLDGAFSAHPSIEPYLDQKFADAEAFGPAETLLRLKRVLGPIRLQLVGNRIVSSVRYEEDGVGSYEIYADLGNSVARLTKVPGAEAYDITPGVTTVDFRITVTIVRVDDFTGEDMYETDRSFMFDIDEVWAL